MNQSPEAPSPAVEALSRNMLRKRLFVMWRRPLAPHRAPEFIEAHLRWVIAAEERGQVFASGPFVAPGVEPGRPGSPAGGMTVLRVGSLEEAEALARSDPYVSSGIVNYEIKEWLVMEGSIHLRVSFSSARYSLD